GSYAVLAPLSRGYSPSEGRLPTCYAPVRRAPTVLLQPRTRLACVKHAASVRSEPGSNSRLKPVARACLLQSRQKNVPIFTGTSLPKQIVVARFTQSICARKRQMERTDSGTSYRLSKSDKPPCPAERHPNNPTSIRSTITLVNTAFLLFHSLP